MQFRNGSTITKKSGSLRRRSTKCKENLTLEAETVCDDKANKLIEAEKEETGGVSMNT